MVDEAPARRGGLSLCGFHGGRIDDPASAGRQRALAGVEW